MIFITGCNGLVGSFLAKKLIANGEKILALRRSTSNTFLLHDIEDSIEWIEGDILDIEVLNKAMERCDTVIHAAAIISFSNKNRDIMYDVNVIGTANMVNAALKNNIKKFCYISSIAAIGRKKDTFKIDESTLWEDSEMNTNYAQTKYLAELEVWRAIEEGLPAFIVNPSVILGPGLWDNGSTKLFHFVFHKNKFYTKGQLNYVDVNDVVKFIILLLKKEVYGERFILNGGWISYKELFTLIARSFDVKPPNILINSFLSEIAWRVEMVRTMFSSTEPILTKETVKLSGFSFEYSNEKITNLLGIPFTPLTETIERTCNELKQRYVHK